MARRAKYFELLDFPKFSVPNVIEIEAGPTALRLTERLGGGGFMSYGQVLSRVGDIIRGLATEAWIVRQFKAYKDDWKNESIREVARLLAKVMGGKGTWYPEPSKPIYVLGFWFKPSIRGIWFYEGQAYAVLINARKGQPLGPLDVAFLARGIYELHCIDDPNDPIPLIIDLSEHERGEGRDLRVFTLTAEEAISLERFEKTLKLFLNALNLAGISLPVPADVDQIVSLFKKK